MKRMKALLGVVLCIALVLSLSLTAFADGTIKVLNPPSETEEYNLYKIFDAEVINGEIVYTTDDSTLAGKLIDDAAVVNLILTENSGTYTVTKTPQFSAEAFQSYIHTNKAALGLNAADETTTGALLKAGIDVDPGYWYIEYAGDEPFALTTVLEGKEVSIEKKNDLVFDKDVHETVESDAADIAAAERDVATAKTAYETAQTEYDAAVADRDAIYADPGSTNQEKADADDEVTDKETALNDAIADYNTALAALAALQYDNDSHDKESVQKGDVLHYEINAKVPYIGTNTEYNLKIWDKLSEGLELNNGTITITLKKDGEAPVTVNLTAAPESTSNPIQNTAKGAQWVNTTGTYTDVLPTFVMNFDLSDEAFAGKGGWMIVIEYDATVTEDVGVIVNTAHLVSNDYNKDAETENYVNQIQIDKYQTGAAEVKLEGAQFILAKDPDATVDPNTNKIVLSANATYYKYDATNEKVTWVADQADGDVKTTESDGSAEFIGLEDGTYYLVEIAAPTGYVMLDSPIEVVVNGKASLDPNNTVENDPVATNNNQVYQLTNVSHVANTPGSVLPSTGGRGTTMLYMAGLGMMLAAGAFLIFRRRAEAGK